MKLTDYLIIGLIVALGVFIVVLLTKKSKNNDNSEIAKQLDERFRSQNELTLKIMSSMNSSHKSDTEAMRASVDTRLRMIQQENSRKLDEIRSTVDERLAKNVSEGIEGSFKTVSGQLDAVSRSIGELKGMSGEITDLKRVLGGVKQRGNWGEAQLQAILSDMLPKEGYYVQHSVEGTREKVDFAIKLPGESSVLPVDSKFPMERYAQVMAAWDNGDAAAEKTAEEGLKRAVIEQAKSIRKYIVPPATTDFAVMFIPSEAIYSHICSLGITADLMREYGVMTAGPSNMSALISTIDMGCIKFAVEEKSEQILIALKEIKKELAKLSDSASLAKRNIDLASGHIGEVSKRLERLSVKMTEAEKL